MAILTWVSNNHARNCTLRERVLPVLEHPKLAHHKAIIEEGFQRADDSVAVFVVGEGNFGKSSLINAFFGHPVAVVDFLPSTWHITRYLPPNGDKPRFEICYNVTMAAAERFEADCRRLCPQAQVEAGQVRLATVAELRRILTSEDSLCRTQSQHSPVWQVIETSSVAAGRNWPWELVDTPGIAQSRPGSVEQETIDDFYHRADVVLWLLLADRLNSRETRHYLRALSRYGKPMIGVVNRADLIPPGLRSETEEFVRRTFDGLLADVILLSARDAFQAKQSGCGDALIQSGLPLLEDAVGKLADAPTKALSLYSTCSQAAREGAAILRQEADVLESNLQLFRKNQEIGRSFTKRGRESLSDTALVALRESLLSEVRKAVDETKDLTNRWESLYSKASVAKAIRTVVDQRVEAMCRPVQKVLETVQDEIGLNQYEDLAYGADAGVKARSLTASLSVTMESVSRHVRLPDIHALLTTAEKRWRAVLKTSRKIFDETLPTAGYVATEVSDLVYTWWTDKDRRSWTERSGAEARRQQAAFERQRHREYDELVGDLPRLTEEVANRTMENVHREIEATATNLLSAVEQRFTDVCGTAKAVQDRIRQFRAQADQATIPPPLIYSATKMLRASLASKAGISQSSHPTITKG